MAPVLQVRGLKRLVAAQITIDESTGVALSQEHLGPREARQGFWLTGIGVYIFWNIFTLAGALGAQAMGNPAAWGLDAAVPAAFLGLLWPSLKSLHSNLVALFSALLTICLIPFTPNGVPVVVAAPIAVLLVYLLIRSKLIKPIGGD